MNKTSQYGNRSDSNQKKPDGRRNHVIRKNQNKSDKRIGDSKRIRKGRRTSIQEQQNILC